LLLYAAFWYKAAQVGMEDGGISFPPNEVCHGVNSATRMWHSCTESVIQEVFESLQDITLLVATILSINTLTSCLLFENGPRLKCVVRTASSRYKVVISDCSYRGDFAAVFVLIQYLHWYLHLLD
jgi:hypothetical protein